MATFFRQLGPDHVTPLTEALVRWHRKDGRPLDPRITRREVTRALQDPQGWQLWFIEQEGAVVGYVAVNFRPGMALEATRAYLAGLFLEPGSRHCGLGRQARRLVQDLGRWLHVKVFDFETEDEAKHALALTRHAGVLRAWMDDTSWQATA
ncbi:MAG TPA: GNAT family N-acetyltransferase [Gemmatimonadales bacterium]|nr:GNAT family N-acetyltransferase [Gemmatimonadales bacterium]